MLTSFELGLLAHLTADWLLQNDWMAKNKWSLKHPAAWVHAGIHTILLGLALGWIGGLVLGFIHLLVDTRVPMRWWQRVFRQTTTGDVALHVAIWEDQVIHIVCIGLWIALAARSGLPG
jgi:hypothetical protein